MRNKNQIWQPSRHQSTWVKVFQPDYWYLPLFRNQYPLIYVCHHDGISTRRAENKKAMLASLKDELLEKQNALIRQAVRANPELLEQAAAKITSGFVKERLMAYDSIKDAYDAGAKDLCADLIAPVIAMYEVEIKQLEV